MAREYELVQDIRLWYRLRNDHYIIRELLKKCCKELRHLQEQRALTEFLTEIFGWS